MDIELEKSRHEEWYKEKFPFLYKLYSNRMCRDEHEIAFANSETTWLAAKAQTVPEGFVLVPEDLAENIALELAKSEFKKSETIFNSAHRDSSVDSGNNLKQKWIEQKTRCILVDYKTLIGKAREQSHD